MDYGTQMIHIILIILAFFFAFFTTGGIGRVIDKRSHPVDYNRISEMEMEIWGRIFPESWNAYDGARLPRFAPPKPPTMVKPKPVINQNAMLGNPGVPIDPATGYTYGYRGDLDNIIADEFKWNGGMY